MQLRLLPVVLIALIASSAPAIAQHDSTLVGSPFEPTAYPGTRTPRIELPDDVQEFQVRDAIAKLDDWQLARLLDNARRLRRNEDLRRRFEREKPEFLPRVIELFRLEPRAVLPGGRVVEGRALRSTIREMEWEFAMRGMSVRGDELQLIYEDPPELQDITRPHLDASEEAIRQSARSVVAIVKRGMMTREDVDADGIDEFILTTKPVQEYFSAAGVLCDYTGFYDYPATIIEGTGFLVDEDHIVTAEHVTAIDDFLGSVYFVFDYVFLEDLTPRTVYELEQVYEGTAIILQQSERTGHDFALIELSASPESNGYEPLPLSGSKVAGDADVYMVGHPLGMPQMYAGPAKARPNLGCDYFDSTLESYPRFSGSPVFNGIAQGLVEGLLTGSLKDLQNFCECTTYVRPEDRDVISARVQLIQPAAGVLHHRNEVLVVNETEDSAWVETDILHEIMAGTEEAIPWAESMRLVQPLEPLEDLDDLGNPGDLTPDDRCDLDYEPWEGQVWAVRASPSGTSTFLRTCDEGTSEETP